MAKTRTQTLDDEDVGKGQGNYFSPTQNKQIIAAIPSFIPKTDLEISDELKKKAESGDRVSVDEIEERTRLRDNILAGTKKEPPRAKEVTISGAEGYLYGRVDSHPTHYQEGFQQFLCKADEFIDAGKEPVCCKNAKRDAQTSYVVPILVYGVDSEGDIELLPEARQKPLDDDHKLDFKFSIQFWTLTDARMRVWKQFFNKFPPISTDFEVWTKPQGKSTILQAGPSGREQALWLRRGPVLVSRIITEGAKMWENAHKLLGRDMSLEEIETLYGIKSTKSSEEVDFKNLLGS